MSQLILLRHGESLWNNKNLFTGWIDVPLSEAGIQEAKRAGDILEHLPLDVVFCSTLIRSIMTAMIALAKRESTPVILHDRKKTPYANWDAIHSEKTAHEILPVYLSDALNERMYGDLQGLNKKETMARFGEEQVHIWRRSFDIAPPHGESLKMTMERTLPYFHSTIVPQLTKEQNVLIVAHGNSLRSIIKEIENVSDKDIPTYELQTGVPLCYEFSKDGYSKKGI